MKSLILVFAILSLSFPLASSAESYSCRDKNGQLHVADNLMSLPPECLHHAETGDPNDSGKVNFVPPAAQSHQSDNNFERAVSQEERKAEQRKREEQRLISQAEDLANRYENGVIKRKEALRNKKYGFRDLVISADQEIQSAREGKKDLLDKLDQARLTAPQREQIKRELNKILD